MNFFERASSRDREVFLAENFHTKAFLLTFERRNKELKRDASTHKFADEILILSSRAANRFYSHFYLVHRKLRSLLMIVACLGSSLAVP